MRRALAVEGSRPLPPAVGRASAGGHADGSAAPYGNLNRPRAVI